MFRDFLLASAHHLLFFGLIAMLVLQSVLLSRTPDAASIARLVRIDRGYGLVAVLLLLVGGVRVFHGLKGPDFYLHNPWLHAKLGLFVVAALLSIWPTLAFLAWRRQLRTAPGWQPEAGQVARLRRVVRIELLLVALILVAAAGMARHGGLRF